MRAWLVCVGMRGRGEWRREVVVKKANKRAADKMFHKKRIWEGENKEPKYKQPRNVPGSQKSV